MRGRGLSKRGIDGEGIWGWIKKNRCRGGRELSKRRIGGEGVWGWPRDGWVVRLSKS